uniref:Uncharacterized protein n=1 Tax=Arundo donax TaxID=35708 RepID=A0A0A8XPE4_ARUDO
MREGRSVKRRPSPNRGRRGRGHRRTAARRLVVANEGGGARWVRGVGSRTAPFRPLPAGPQLLHAAPCGRAVSSPSPCAVAFPWRRIGLCCIRRFRSVGPCLGPDPDPAALLPAPLLLSAGHPLASPPARKRVGMSLDRDQR